MKSQACVLLLLVVTPAFRCEGESSYSHLPITSPLRLAQARRADSESGALPPRLKAPVDVVMQKAADVVSTSSKSWPAASWANSSAGLRQTLDQVADLLRHPNRILPQQVVRVANIETQTDRVDVPVSTVPMAAHQAPANGRLVEVLPTADSPPGGTDQERQKHSKPSSFVAIRNASYQVQDSAIPGPESYAPPGTQGDEATVRNLLRSTLDRLAKGSALSGAPKWVFEGELSTFILYDGVGIGAFWFRDAFGVPNLYVVLLIQTIGPLDEYLRYDALGATGDVSRWAFYVGALPHSDDCCCDCRPRAPVYLWLKASDPPNPTKKPIWHLYDESVRRRAL